MAAAPTDLASLLAERGLPSDAQRAAAEHGTNNQTIIVSALEGRRAGSSTRDAE